MPKVLNHKNYGLHGVWPFPDKDTYVYVGRPSKWGNPFPLSVYSREEAVQRYKDEILPALRDQAKQELKGKDLMCFCSPLPCHADALLEAANES